MAPKSSCGVSFLVGLALLLLLSTFILPCSSSFFSSSTSSFNSHSITSITSLCNSTPYPARCFEISKLFSIGIPKISVPHLINLPPVLLGLGNHALQQAFSEASRLTSTIVALESVGIVEKLKGTIQDCKELHYITLDLLQSCVAESSSSTVKSQNVVAFLSAALTNKQTCFESLESASGLFKPLFTASLNSVYEHVSNALAIFVKGTGTAKKTTKMATTHNRRLSEFPSWLSRKDRSLLQSSGSGEYDPNSILIVAQDGSGNFTTISDAILAVPKKSPTRVVVYVKEGIYDEHVEIPRSKEYVALLGDGAGRTIITGNRSVGDGWTTFRSATLAVMGSGFLARDITVRNTAGAAKGQAVALRVGSDLSAIYRCNIEGNQDTLYAHSLRQFYRDDVIAGTVDFIFGNAAAVFQGCQIVARNPMSGQTIDVTAQGRSDPNQDTGFSFQGCTLLPDEQLAANLGNVRSYLGRPWRIYSRTVFMESYLGQHIHPSGWSPWSGDTGLATLYYGEYANTGPASNTANRVNWPGFHIMSYDDAINFTVPSLILGNQWLDSTAVPYNAGL